MPLNVQKYLRDGGTLEGLTEDLGIRIHHHSELPLVGFSYSQIDSPKTNNIVRESRGLTLEKGSWRIVAKAFNRFFRLGEFAEEYETFNWSDFDCYTKADGSLVLVYNYQGKWYAKTRGSFGGGEVPNNLPDYSPSFSELFWDIMKDKGIDLSKVLDPANTYVFEMCSKFNKVVRLYEKPTAYLLAVFNNETAKELAHDSVDTLSVEAGLDRVERFHFTSLGEVQAYMKQQEDADPTYEGVIVCDDKLLRFKVKSITYDALHHMFDNGNIYNPKRLVPWALNPDPSTLLETYPEVKEHLDAVKGKVDESYDQLLKVWKEHHKIEEQRTFAQAIKGKTPFMGLLFALRKKTGIRGPGGFAPGEQTEEQLYTLWRDSVDGIVKVLFK
jgi:hypothetical protein